MTTKWGYCNRSYYGTRYTRTINHTRTRDRKCAYFVDVCARYVHVVCVCIIIATWFVVCSGVSCSYIVRTIFLTYMYN